MRFIEISETSMSSHEKREKPWVLSVIELFCQQKSPSREVMLDFAKIFMGGVLGDGKLRRWVCSKESVSPHRLDDDPYGFGEPGMVMMGWLFANLDKVRVKTSRNGWEGIRRHIAAQPNQEAGEKTAAKYLYDVLRNTVRRELARGSEDALLAKRVSEMLAAMPEFVERTKDTWVLQGGETWPEGAGLDLDSLTEELLADPALYSLIEKAQQRPERRGMRTFLNAVWAKSPVALTTWQIKELIHQFFGVVSDSARMTSIEELKERTGREPSEDRLAELEGEEDEDLEEEEKEGDHEQVDEEDPIDPGTHAEEVQRGATQEAINLPSSLGDRALALLRHIQALDGSRLYHPTEQAKRGSVSQEFLGFIVWSGLPLKDGKGTFGQQQYIDAYGGKDTKRVSERLVEKLGYREKRVWHSTADKPLWINTKKGRAILKPVLGLKHDQLKEVIDALRDLLAARVPSWCPNCVQWPPAPCPRISTTGGSK